MSAARHVFLDVSRKESRVCSFFNQSRGVLLAGEAHLAGTSSERRKGLLGKKALQEGQGLWIVPCEAIHTFGMQTAIDSIFLDKDLRVRALHPHLKPSRIAFCLRAHSVLELAAGTIDRSQTKVGDKLCLQ